MAQQTEAIFNLKVNTGNSVEDVEKLDKAIKDTQTTAGTGKGVEDFAKKLDTLDKQLAEGNLTMRQRSRLVKEYQQIALQAGETSPVGERAVRSAAALSDEIADMNQRVRMLASDTVKLDTALEGIGVGASVFQGVQSAISLTGVENEELIKSMQKLQAVQGVTNAIQQVTNALNKDAILGIQLRIGLEKARNFIMTGTIAGTTALAGAEAGLAVSTNTATLAMKALRLALIATGIGAIVVVLGLLANAMGVFGDKTDDAEKKQKALDKAMKELEKTSERQKKVNDELTATIDRQTRAELARAKAVGATQEEMTRVTREGMVRRLQLAEVELKELQKRYIDASKNAPTEVFNSIEKSYQEALSTVQDLRLQLTEFDAEQTAKRREQAKKRAEEQRAEREQYFAHLKELDDILSEALEREEKRRVDFANFLQTQNDELLAESERRYLEQLKREEEAEQRSLELQNAYRRLIQSELENELEDLRLNYADKENIINQAWANRMISDEERNRQLLQLQEQQAKDEIELEKRKQQELREEQEKAFAERVAGIERIIGYTQQLANATASINQFMNASDNERLKQAKGNEVEEEKIKRRIFERDKKLRKVQVAIDTASNVITSIKNNGGIPYGLPAGAIAFTAGAFQLAAISKATLDGGAGLQTASPQQLSAPVQSQQTNTSQLPETEQPQQQQTVKVVVLENDITNIQQRVKVAENLSSF